MLLITQSNYEPLNWKAGVKSLCFPVFLQYRENGFGWVMGENTENVNLEVQKQIKVFVSSDEMEAKINIPVVYELDMEPYIFSRDEVLDALEKNEVKYGIEKETIDKIVEDRIYGRDIVVAHGTAPVDGVDAKFDFFFDTNLTSKPAIREDGTADYWSIHLVELVKKRQVVAKYCKAVPGKDGMTTKGKTVRCKNGRELPPITGHGFYKVDDNNLYVSNIDGKIEYTNKKIFIMPVYEIYGDVCMKTGNISFKGDVIIHGNVRKGMEVESTGTVTVDGVVEAADIIAEKGILIRGGVQGGKRANIISKAEINAGFIEYANVEAEGVITADSILDSTVVSHDKIIVQGPNASIVGGTAYATSGILASSVGNRHGVKTEITSGKPMNLMQEMFMLQSQVYDDKALVDKIDTALKKSALNLKNAEASQKKNIAKMELLRAKVSKQADIARNSARLEYINMIMDKAKGATIVVEHDIFQGSVISIDGQKTTLEQKQDGVEFVETDKNLRMYSLAAMEAGGVI